ncbi:MAG TPA: DUF692 domain-containing protein [Myxococcales bacterium]|nr:DUF692 domain-containing protein [Myxococcales bacterium]
MRRRPVAGVGIGLRAEFGQELLQSDRTVDWLEIVPENFMGRGGAGRRLLHACRERWPIRAHGVALNLGGPDPLREDYLESLGDLLAELGGDTFTEHLSYSAIGGRYYHDLLPLPFTREAAEHVAGRAAWVRESLGHELLLENITAYARMPGSELPEGRFIELALREAGAGLLLDVNNVYVNARNQGVDPLAALEALPLELTRQIHLAGHHRVKQRWLDDHGAPVADEVWRLFAAALSHTGPVPVLIEWDNYLPPLDRILDEADRARAIVAAVCAPPPAERARELWA